MAGSGYKLFVNGTTLSASDLNTYVQQQTVMVFASASARTTALASVLSEGMISYRTDAHVLEVYNGSAWVAPETNLTTKGDLATYDTAPSRLGVGSDGSTLIANSSASTGLSWQGVIAGAKNALINGAFDYWQRGTSGFSQGGSYNADRWKCYYDGAGATIAITQQSLAGAITGVDSPYFWQAAQTVAGSGATVNLLYQLIENVQTYSGQNIVLSFWCKSDSTRSMLTPTGTQNFGSGGSSSVGVTFTAASNNPANITTAWQRFSFTASVPSVSGKTIGSSSYLEIDLKLPINAVHTTGVAGVQLEVGSVATAFSRAGNTLQGELAACQRYYLRYSTSVANGLMASSAFTINSTIGVGIFAFPVEMRVAPTNSADYGNLAFSNYLNTSYALSAVVVDTTTTTTKVSYVYGTISGATGGQPGYVKANNNSAGYIGFSAEL